MKLYIITVLVMILAISFHFIFLNKKNESLKGRTEKILHINSQSKMVQGVQSFSVGGLLYRAPLVPLLEIGDLIIVVGNYSEQVISPLYTEKYLEVQDIKIIQKYDEISIIKRITYNPIIEAQYRLLSLKTWAIMTYKKRLSLDSSGLLAGMVLGSKESISPTLYDDMKVSGLAHLVVASGSNVAMVAAVVLTFFSFLSRNKKYLISSVVIWGYAVLAGMDPPIIRAAIMINIIWIAQLLGRKTSGMWILTLTSLLMVLVSPPIIFSLSFQLSVAATAGLVMYSQMLNQIAQIIGKKNYIFGWLAALAVQTIAAQILIYPLLLHYFASTNIISIGANMAVAGLVTPVVLSGMALLLCTFFLPDVAIVFTIPLEIALRYISWIGVQASNFTFAILEFELHWWGAIMWWMVVWVGMNWIKRKVVIKMASEEN